MCYNMNDREINQWAKSLMETHKSPRKKLELPGTKFFLPCGAPDEKGLVNNALNTVANALKRERVERRCARSVANWLPEQRLAEITKGGRILNTCGFANKNGRFLYPEEAMFLLETNRLELFWNGVPLSIQQAYEVILNDPECNLAKYLTYRKLALQGFRLQRSEHIQRPNAEEPKPKKRRLSESEQGTSYQDQCSEIIDSQTSTENDKISLETSNNSKPATSADEAYNVAQGIFKKLRESGPKKLEVQHQKVDDYNIFLSDNSSRTSPNFSLRMSEDKCIDPSVGFLSQSVVGYATSEDAGYFRFGRVSLPDL